MSVPPRNTAGPDDEFSRQALAELPAVLRVARALTRNEPDADDLVQETYLRAFRHRHTFLPGSDCRRWLCAICRHTYFGQRARERWVTAVGDDLELETFAVVHAHGRLRERGQDDLFARIDLAPAIRAAIEALPPLFAEVVRRVDVEGLSYEEAALALGIPVGTVRSRLYRARRQLQDALIAYALDGGFSRIGDHPTPESRHAQS